MLELCIPNWTIDLPSWDPNRASLPHICSAIPNSKIYASLAIAHKPHYEHRSSSSSSLGRHQLFAFAPLVLISWLFRYDRFKFFLSSVHIVVECNYTCQVTLVCDRPARPRSRWTNSALYEYDLQPMS